MGLPPGIAERVEELVAALAAVPEGKRIEVLNAIRWRLHLASPFAREPVDCVLWFPAEAVEANDYNPNVVAPPEMRLLQHSIRQDGYTQPIVGFDERDHIEVVDGFHRNRVGRECPDVRERLRGHLPITLINADRSDRADRIAATIRHNRARGRHAVTGMSDIVLELSRRNWSDEKIGRELGMEPDEVLRLKQITGLAELFADKDFSEAWEEGPPESL
ncbi:MAG: transcriptional regulator [Bacillota bacterium]|nr:MAG: transcriptional regulator [Bacillota bacterium]